METEVSHPPTRAARWYWSLCAIAGGVLTVLVNVAHGLGKVPAPRTIPAGIVSAVPPLMTIALFEGYFIVKRCAPQRVLRVVMASVIVLGGAAFSISYTSIAMFLNRQPGDLPEWTGWVMPALLDVFVVVSAYVLYVLSKHRPTAVQSPKSTAPSPWRRIADAATNRAVATLTVPENPQVTVATEARGAAVEEPRGALTEPSAPVAEPAVEPSTKPAVEVQSTAVEPIAEVKPTATETSPEPVAEPIPAELQPYMEAATAMVEAGVVARKTAVEVAEVIAAIERRMSPNGIKTTLGVASGTTAKISSAWREMKEQPAQLTAVG